MYDDISSTNGRNAFKKTEKEIKSRSHLVFKEDDIIDIQRASDFPGVVDNGSMMFRGEEKKVYGFEAMPDLLIVANVLPTWMQVEAAHFALSSCPQFPNGTNLGPNQASGVWERRKHLLDVPAGGKIPTLRELMLSIRSSELGHLRWSALGYQYDWTARKYPQASSLTPNRVTSEASTEGVIPQTFPIHLAEVVKEIVSGLPIPGITIEPEAAIVNYYLPGNSMGGHVDDAELTYDHPVVSLSIGRPCVFLVGGYNKDDETPLAVLLRSGDCLLLNGTSRLRMHGVAKVYECPYGEKRKRSKTVTGLTACTDECRAMCSSGCDMQQWLDADATDVCWGEEFYHESMAGVQCAGREGVCGGGEKRKSNALSEDAKQQVERESEKVVGGVCEHCGQTLLSLEEVMRVKRYLQFARVNINSRQVYPSPTTIRGVESNSHISADCIP